MTDRELDALVAEKVMGWHHAPDWDPEATMAYEPSGDFAYWLDASGKQMAPCVDIIGYHGDESRWAPSSTGDGMLAVIEKMRERGWNYRLHGMNAEGQQLGDEHDAQFSDVRGIVPIEGPEVLANSAPRAVCLAALKALGVEV